MTCKGRSASGMNMAIATTRPTLSTWRTGDTAPARVRRIAVGLATWSTSRTPPRHTTRTGASLSPRGPWSRYLWSCRPSSSSLPTRRIASSSLLPTLMRKKILRHQKKILVHEKKIWTGRKMISSSSQLNDSSLLSHGGWPANWRDGIRTWSSTRCTQVVACMTVSRCLSPHDLQPLVQLNRSGRIHIMSVPDYSTTWSEVLEARSPHAVVKEIEQVAGLSAREGSAEHPSCTRLSLHRGDIEHECERPAPLGCPQRVHRFIR